MAGETSREIIPFDECWTMPVHRLGRIPLKYHRIQVNGQDVTLRRQRAIGSSFTLSRYQSPETEVEHRRARLMETIPDADGYGGWLPDLHRFDDPEAREAEIERLLAERNEDARLQPDVFVAFEHSGNPNPDPRRPVCALARIAGVELDLTRGQGRHPSFGLLVVGKSGIEVPPARIPAAHGYPLLPVE